MSHDVVSALKRCPVSTALSWNNYEKDLSIKILKYYNLLVDETLKKFYRFIFLIFWSKMNKWSARHESVAADLISLGEPNKIMNSETLNVKYSWLRILTRENCVLLSSAQEFTEIEA